MSVIVVTVLFCKNDYLSPSIGSISSPLVVIIMLYPVKVIEFFGCYINSCELFIHSFSSIFLSASLWPVCSWSWEKTMNKADTVHTFRDLLVRLVFTKGRVVFVIGWFS